ncbi:MAG: AgmX/PglI C-terminal domain-containing protein [Myxococcales bacterium]
MKRIVVIAAALAVAGLVVWLLSEGEDPSAPVIERAPSEARVPSPPSEELGAEARAPPPSERGSPERGAPATGAPPPQAGPERAPAVEPRREEGAAPPVADGELAGRHRPETVYQTGTVQKAAIRSAVQAILPDVRACYEEGLKNDPDLEGRVVVEFEIEARDGKGRVVSGHVFDAETQSPFFEACVLSKISGAQFDAPEGGGTVKVRYPFVFDTGAGFGGPAR